MSLERHLIDGACNEPQPWNWKDACRRKPGHDGEHHAFLSRDRDGHATRILAWPGPDGPVNDRAALAPRAYALSSSESARHG